MLSVQLVFHIDFVDELKESLFDLSQLDASLPPDPGFLTDLTPQPSREELEDQYITRQLAIIENDDELLQ